MSIYTTSVSYSPIRSWCTSAPGAKPTAATWKSTEIATYSAAKPPRVVEIVGTEVRVKNATFSCSELLLCKLDGDIIPDIAGISVSRLAARHDLFYPDINVCAGRHGVSGHCLHNVCVDGCFLPVRLAATLSAKPG